MVAEAMKLPAAFEVCGDFNTFSHAAQQSCSMLHDIHTVDLPNPFPPCVFVFTENNPNAWTRATAWQLQILGPSRYRGIRLHNKNLPSVGVRFFCDVFLTLAFPAQSQVLYAWAQTCDFGLLWREIKNKRT